MRFPRFAQTLRQHGSSAEIMRRFGFSRRQTFEYLAGRSLPRAEKILQHPELVEAAQADIRAALDLCPEPLAA
jgi:hypothetical protein